MSDWQDNTLRGEITQTGRWSWRCSLTEGISMLEPALRAKSRKRIERKFYRLKEKRQRLHEARARTEKIE